MVYFRHINGYAFQVNIKPLDKPIMPVAEYEQEFKNKILRLKIDQNAAQLAIALAKEAEQWNLLKKSLPKIKIPMPIDKMPQEIEEALKDVTEVAPETERIPEVKKLTSVKAPRYRINLLPRKPKKTIKSRAQIFAKGWKTLKRSIEIRRKLWAIRIAPKATTKTLEVFLSIGTKTSSNRLTVFEAIFSKWKSPRLS